MIVDLSGETLAELNESIHFDEAGNRYTPAEVATDLYDGYLSTAGTHRGLDAVEASALHSEGTELHQRYRPGTVTEEGIITLDRLRAQRDLLYTICPINGSPPQSETVFAGLVCTEIDTYAKGMYGDSGDELLLPLRILGRKHDTAWTTFERCSTYGRTNHGDADLRGGNNTGLYAILTL